MLRNSVLTITGTTMPPELSSHPRQFLRFVLTVTSHFYFAQALLTSHASDTIRDHDRYYYADQFTYQTILTIRVGRDMYYYTAKFCADCDS